MNAFTAIDVETANADFASICQIGVVRFDDGQVVSEWQSLVNPEDYFSPVNVGIHGITDESVASAPTLPQLHECLMAQLDGNVVICHTAFDRVSIQRACQRHAIPVPDVTWLDSARVARRAWPGHCGQRGYGLKKLAAMLSLNFTAHVAVEDARIAGWVITSAITHTGLSLTDWLTRVQHPILPTRHDYDAGSNDGREGPLANEVIVFTGALSMSRGQAAALAAQAGSNVRDSVSRETTILVVGDQDIRKLLGHEKSSKHRKAEALIQAGQSIRIVGEGDFHELIAND
jgi:DNA polymerase-3 subunit epsilon